MFLGIEIGGTKLQLGLGGGEGAITVLWRGTVNAAEGSEGIRRQIGRAVPELLAQANLDRRELRGIGIGFGGPTDDATQTVITSHQIDGWDGFPLAGWISDALSGVPAVLCNDADVAGLAEAHFGAGKGLSPMFYITVGTGVGGAFIIGGKIHRAVGRGAAEIGHLRVSDGTGRIVEELASGRGIERAAAGLESDRAVSAREIAASARGGNPLALGAIQQATEALSDGICSVIALLCPARIVIGGGVSLMGEDLFFAPLRRLVADRVFAPFRGLTEIVPAALGEEVVVHGALALARQQFGS
jgi:glucokinase